MTNENLVKRDEDTGYIIAWKHKYEFETGKFDEQMTYGEARKTLRRINCRTRRKNLLAGKSKT